MGRKDRQNKLKDLDEVADIEKESALLALGILGGRELFQKILYVTSLDRDVLLPG